VAEAKESAVEPCQGAENLGVSDTMIFGENYCFVLICGDYRVYIDISEA
jgi:hypothetical protein